MKSSLIIFFLLICLGSFGQTILFHKSSIQFKDSISTSFLAPSVPTLIRGNETIAVLKLPDNRLYKVTLTAELVNTDILLEAETPTAQSGTGTEPILGGGTAAMGLDKGDFLMYKLNTTIPRTKVVIKYSRGDSGTSSLEVRIGSVTSPAIATISLSSTGTWNTGYVEVTSPAFATPLKVADVYLTFVDAPGTTGRCNIDWLKFIE